MIGPVSGSPVDHFKHVLPYPAPPDLSRFFRRMMLVEFHEPVDLSFDVAATGYNYFSWVWRGRWEGIVNDEVVLDTDSDGPLFCSGQVNKSKVGARFSGRAGAVMAEFQPFGLFRLLGIRGEDLLESAVSVSGRSPALRPLLELSAVAGNPQSASDALDNFVTCVRRIKPTKLALKDSMIDMVRAIEESVGTVRLNDLCQQHRTSERSFRRQLFELDGISPKRFARVIQTNGALGEMLNGEVNFAEVAAYMGFSDQAHLSRAFRELLGNSPRTVIGDIDSPAREFVGFSQVSGSTRA